MYNTIKNHFHSLLEKDIHDLPLIKRTFIRTIQILYVTGRDLADGQLSLQAMSLVYTTLITLVPLLAISFSVLKGFGVHNQIEPLLLNMLEGLGPAKSAEVTARVIGFVDNIKVGVLGAVGLGLLIYAVVALMQKIEAAFNYIWRVGQDRTLAQRFSDYLSVLLMGPLLIFISAGTTATARNSEIVIALEQSGLLGPFFDISALLIPWIVMAIGFTFVYIYMPNTRVRLSAAFIGALVASLLWKVMGFVFASFIAGSANYVAIYAAFATLIVLMIWLYASWLVVLIGSNVAFYVQYPRFLRASREPLELTPQLQMKLGLSILAKITDSHYNGKEPHNVDSLSKSLNVPILAIQKITSILEEKKIIATSKNDCAGFYPACPFDKTPLQKAIDALEKTGARGWLQSETMRTPKTTTKVMKDMEAARKKSVTSKTIKDSLL